MTKAGSGRRLHRDRQARDHIRGVTGRRGLRDAFDRRELRPGVILGDERDQAGDGQAHERGDEDAGDADVIAVEQRDTVTELPFVAK